MINLASTNKLLLTRVVITLALITVGLTTLQALPTSSVFGEINPSEWAQVQRDSTRSGRADYDLIPPFNTKWRWTNGSRWDGEALPATFNYEIPHLSQPIVGDGKVYIGSFQNALFAVKEVDGTTAWRFDTEGPVLHTAGYANKLVYVGASDGYFYAVNTTDGSLAWKYATGSIYSAPLVLSNKVCIGSKTNYYYCFNLTDTNGDKQGDLIFKYDARAPIYHTAASSTDGSKIYFGSEDMTPHCIVGNTANPAGEKCSGWDADRLPGQSFLHYWPVVVADKVIFTTLPDEASNHIFMDIDSLLRSISGSDWSTVEPQLIANYIAKPYEQTLFVLNATTGKEAYITASSHIAYHNDAMNPPTIGNNNEIFTMYRGKVTAFGASFGTDFAPDVGFINPSTGKITPIAPAGKYSSKLSNDLDDNSIFSSGPQVLYGVHNRRCVVGIDRKTQTDFIAAQISRELYSHCGVAQAYFFNINGEPADTAGYPDPRGYDNRGEGLMPAVIANNTMYVVFRGGYLLAVTGARR